MLTMNTEKKEVCAIKLSDNQITQELCDFIKKHADADTVAWVAGELFGGNCFCDDADSSYTFIPNDNYAGQFDPK